VLHIWLFYQGSLSGNFRFLRRLSGLWGFGQFEAGENRLGRVARGHPGVIVPHLDDPVLGRPAAFPPEQGVQRVVLPVRGVVASNVVASLRRQHGFVTSFLETAQRPITICEHNLVFCWLSAGEQGKWNIDTNGPQYSSVFFSIL